jgi:hypothetical protein
VIGFEIIGSSFPLAASRLPAIGRCISPYHSRGGTCEIQNAVLTKWHLATSLVTPARKWTNSKGSGSPPARLQGEGHLDQRVLCEFEWRLADDSLNSKYDLFIWDYIKI